MHGLVHASYPPNSVFFFCFKFLLNYIKIMCLLTDKLPLQTNQDLICYKILKRADSNLLSVYYNFHYHLNTIYQSELTHKIISSTTITYTNGFHSYCNYEDAKRELNCLFDSNHVLVECKIPNHSLYCCGVEPRLLLPCYVSNRIEIISIIK